MVSMSQDQMDGENILTPTQDMTQTGIQSKIYEMKENDKPKSAENTFRTLVTDMIILDKRFTGMSGYIETIEFYWSYEIETACAGHGFIFFNPDFWDKLDAEQQKTVTAHEIWHLILDHITRGEGYDAAIYNQAADHVINLILRQDQFKMDQDMDFGGVIPCCDPRFSGLSTNQVYQILYKEAFQQPPSGQGSQPLNGNTSKDQIEDMIKKITNVYKQSKDNAAQLEQTLAGTPGHQTGNEGILLEAAKQRVFIQKAPYEKIFEKYLTDPLSGGKRTYVRPSRRQRRGDLRLKGSYPKRGKHNRLTHLVYALDVSGSISRTDANLFLTSANTLKERLNPELMTIMLWDTQIKYEHTFKENEKLDKIRVQAGGGTSLNPVYKRVEALNPEALVIFTDLEVSIPPQPKWDTIWFVSQHINNTYLQHVSYGNVYQIPELN